MLSPLNEPKNLKNAFANPLCTDVRHEELRALDITIDGSTQCMNMVGTKRILKKKN